MAKKHSATPQLPDDVIKLLRDDASDQQREETTRKLDVKQIGRQKRIRDAWDKVRYFTTHERQTEDDTAPPEFWHEWTGHIVQLGSVLKAEGVDHRLNTLKPRDGTAAERRAFQFCISIFQAAVQGNHDLVEQMLLEACPAKKSKQSDLFRLAVNESLRRRVMEHLIAAEYPPVARITHRAPPRIPPPQKLGELLRVLERSERTYEANMQVAEQQHPLVAHHTQIQAKLLRYRPNRELSPGIDRIQLLCDERFGEALNASAIRRIRAEACRVGGIDVATADGLTFGSVADILEGKKDSVGGNFVPTDSQAGPTNPYSELLDWAKNHLKGIELRIIELVARNGGRYPLVDLASDAGIGWEAPFDGAWNAARVRINKKLKRAPVPDKLRRQGNNAVLESALKSTNSVRE